MVFAFTKNHDSHAFLHAKKRAHGSAPHHVPPPGSCPDEVAAAAKDHAGRREAEGGGWAAGLRLSVLHLRYSKTAATACGPSRRYTFLGFIVFSVLLICVLA